MNSKQKKIWDAILNEKVSSNIRWKDIEALFIHLGATLKEGNGSRIRIRYQGKSFTFHRPHPSPYATKATVKDIRKILQEDV